MILARFENHPGRSKIVDRDYLFHEVYTRRLLSRDLSLDSALKPGDRIDMCVSFRLPRTCAGICPVCNCDSNEVSDEVEWYEASTNRLALKLTLPVSSKCGLWYQSVIVTDKGEKKEKQSSLVELDSSRIPSSELGFGSRRRKEGADGAEDVIQHFRRVQVIHSFPYSRLIDKVGCLQKIDQARGSGLGVSGIHTRSQFTTCREVATDISCTECSESFLSSEEKV